MPTDTGIAVSLAAVGVGGQRVAARQFSAGAMSSGRVAGMYPRTRRNAPGEPTTRENPMSNSHVEDEAAIAAVLDASYKAWAAGDAEGMVADYTPDATAIMTGSLRDSREVIRENMALAFAGPLKETSTSNKRLSIMLNWFSGREKYGQFMDWVFEKAGTDWRLEPLTANGQPGFAAYCRVDDGYHLHTLQIFTVTTDGISRNSVFQVPEIFAAFALPLALDSHGQATA
jgi:hypothetical protein